MTDHNGFFLTISFEENKRGVGFWKFNNLHLTKPEFLETMNQMFENITMEYKELDPIEKWELFKFPVSKRSARMGEASCCRKTLNNKPTL